MANAPATSVSAYEMIMSLLKTEVIHTAEVINYKLKFNKKNESINLSEIKEFPTTISRQYVDRKLYELYYALGRLNEQLQELKSSLEDEEDYSAIISSWDMRVFNKISVLLAIIYQWMGEDYRKKVNEDEDNDYDGYLTGLFA